MKKLLLRIYNIFILLINAIKWKCESILIRKKISTDQKIEEIPKGKKLILLPHSDDEWIGCSQIITKFNDEVVLCNMDMQGGDNKELHEQRLKEIHKVSEKYNISLINIKEKKGFKLNEYINQYKPKMVFVPFFIDWHNEHVETIEILYEAIKQGIDDKFKIAMYQVSLPILPEKINSFVPMNKSETIKKWNFFKSNYRTQVKIPYKRFYYNEKINGSIFKSYAAEVYSIYEVDKWLDDIKKWKITDSEKETLITNINSISKVRRELQKVYERIENE